VASSTDIGHRMAESAAPLSVCVYGSSSKSTPEAYLEASREMGRLLAEGGHHCINGGGKGGCMGAVNQGALGGGGHVTAVLHRMWMESEGGTDGTITDDDLQSMASDGAVLDVLVADGPTLTVRKEMLAEEAECFIAMPGGCGTFEEVWEIVCQRQLALPAPTVEGGPRGRGPVCLVNTDGFYDGFMAVVERASADGMLHWQDDGGSDLLKAVATPAEALDYCIAAVAAERAMGGSAAAATAAAGDDSPVAGSAALGVTVPLLGDPEEEKEEPEPELQSQVSNVKSALGGLLGGLVLGFAVRARL
jgi:uncharacterized protein (TIGR00730 family)